MKVRYTISFILVTLLAACGQKAAEQPASTPAVATPPATIAQTPAPAAAEVVANGESAYKKTCALCHQTGVAGAPIVGNTADWAPRIAQGNDVLYAHAIKGFTGSKGVMPPRGGGMTLSDNDVNAAVDFMVAKSK